MRTILRSVWRYWETYLIILLFVLAIFVIQYLSASYTNRHVLNKLMDNQQKIRDDIKSLRGKVKTIDATVKDLTE